VAIIPTGSELTPIGSELGAGQIVEYNSLMLAAQVNSMGAIARRFPIVRDELESIVETVSRAAEENDLVLLNAGSSAGAEDFSSTVVARLGTVLVHGVAVRPGHPVILGLVQSVPAGRHPPRAIVGIPGYPVSAALTVEIFVEPLLAAWQGREPREAPLAQVEFTQKITSPAGDEDYVRVAIGRLGGRLLAAPLARGAGIITSLVQADGVVIIPPGVQGIEMGERVTARLYRTHAELDQTIFCIGSHDVALDLGPVSGKGRPPIVSANADRRADWTAPSRICPPGRQPSVDPQTAEYNIPFIRVLPGVPVKVVSLASGSGPDRRRGIPRALRASRI
jgi:putative molybdopterin biosynthesis protein